MTYRPIIFSAPMVRALLAGRKTQTRRLASSPLAKCRPGDRLYVRESYLDIRPFRDAPVFAGMTGDAAYMADNTFIGCHKWTPSIHMPRRASRLTLVVSDVRQQRLWELTEEDALAEGVAGVSEDCPPETAFAALWDSLHGQKKGEAWHDNPAIVALTFAVHRVNIDAASFEQVVSMAMDLAR